MVMKIGQNPRAQAADGCTSAPDNSVTPQETLRSVARLASALADKTDQHENKVSFSDWLERQLARAEEEIQELRDSLTTTRMTLHDVSGDLAKVTAERAKSDDMKLWLTTILTKLDPVSLNAFQLYILYSRKIDAENVACSLGSELGTRQNMMAANIEKHRTLVTIEQVIEALGIDRAWFGDAIRELKSKAYEQTTKRTSAKRVANAIRRKLGLK